jgi:ribosome-associated protein
VHSKELVELVEDSMSDLKAVDIHVLDVSRMTSITDFMVIASGTSDRHVRSIAERVVERARHAGHAALGIEGHEYGEWVLVDLGDVVVHVMQPATRDFYKLENLWGMQEHSGAAGGLSSGLAGVGPGH